MLIPKRTSSRESNQISLDDKDQQLVLVASCAPGREGTGAKSAVYDCAVQISGGRQNEQPSQLARYAFTQANVTVLRLRRSHVPEKMLTTTTAAAAAFSRSDYASVHDSLLALYHGVRLHHHSTASCQWAGSDYILPTLHKVPVFSWGGRF